MTSSTKSLALLCALASSLIGPLRGQDSHPPLPITQPAPSFPYEMRRKGIGGRVLVEFIIGVDGTVIDAKVLKATRPEFGPPAMQAVRKWRFKPGMKDGRTVNVRATQVLDFDVPTTRSVAPFELLEAGRTGTATVGFWLDERGGVRKTAVLEASDPACGHLAEALIALEQQAKPQLDEKPGAGMWQTRYDFAPEKPAAAILKRLKKGKPAFVDAHDLDAPLDPKARQTPIYPANLRESGVNGDAVIEFFVDERGAVQLPRVVSSSREEFGWAAAVAVAQWTFTPPRVHGSAVTVRVRLPVEFVFGHEAE